jgi:hypothetical protein
MPDFVYTYVVSKSAKTASAHPKQVEKALDRLGADLRIARVRRRESLRSWAPRIGVSIPTLQRMEAGDPSVGVSVYATALWVIGRIEVFSELADPARDEQALLQEIMKIERRGGARAKPKSPE